MYLLAHVASLSSFSFLVKSYDSLLGWLQEDVKIVKLGQKNFNIYRTLEFFRKLKFFTHPLVFTMRAPFFVYILLPYFREKILDNKTSSVECVCMLGMIFVY